MISKDTPTKDYKKFRKIKKIIMIRIYISTSSLKHFVPRK
jgi:hypothetical protein